MYIKNFSCVWVSSILLVSQSLVASCRRYLEVNSYIMRCCMSVKSSVNQLNYPLRNWTQVEANSGNCCIFAVLSDPAKRLDYDLSGTYEINRYSLRVRILSDNIKLHDIHHWFCISHYCFLLERLYSSHDNCYSFMQEYLTRFKGMILTCNGLGINHSSAWRVLL